MENLPPTGQRRELRVRQGPAALLLQLANPGVLAAVLVFDFAQVALGDTLRSHPFVVLGAFAVLALLVALVLWAHFAQAAWLEGPVLARRTFLPVRRIDLRTAQVWFAEHQFVGRGRYLNVRDPGSGRRIRLPLDPFGRGLLPAQQVLALADAIGADQRPPADAYHAWGVASGLHDLATNPAAADALARKRRVTTAMVVVAGVLVGICLLCLILLTVITAL